jgi:flagellar basal-body rod modification protein FlgD
MIDSLSSLPSTNLSTVPASNAKSNASLQMDDFLQLLTSQITNQDPLEPMKDTEFISQMANIASLEQMEQFSKGFSKFADSQHAMLAQGYLGHEVKIQDNDREISGIVESINTNDEGTPEIVVNGSAYSPSSIKEVKLVQKQ